MDSNRPLRSWMFVPGNVERFLAKASGLDVDAVFLDLEDGVPVANKPDARDLIAQVLSRPVGGPARFVRVNAPGSDWYVKDLEAVLVPGIDGVCLPKVESADEVRKLAERLSEFESEHGVPDGEVRIVAAIESAVGLLCAPEIAASHTRMLGLMFGAEDYALDLGLGTEREAEAGELLYARSSLVVSAASARILSIDGVYPNLGDEDGLLADILQARRLGFSAKSTFNPRQVEHINRIFSPQPDEIAYAREVAEAFALAQKRGEGSVAVGGQLVDLPIVRRAQRLLELVDVETEGTG